MQLFFIKQGRYRRVDRFQEDMFEVFEFARQVSRTDSQVINFFQQISCTVYNLCQ